MKTWVAFFALGALFFNLSGLALPAPSFSEQVVVDRTPLIRNGVGTRKATVFKVRVYEAALYLRTKNGDAESILKSPEPKQMELQFVRSVDQKAIREAWGESFKKACDPDCQPFEQNLKSLQDVMGDLQEGDRQTYQITQKGLRYLLNGQEKLKIDDPAFARTVLATWIGKYPPNTSLRDGLLGKEN